MRYPALRSIADWLAATDAQRLHIATEIGHEHGLTFERVAPFRRADLPLASYRGLDDLFRFVLVPGGRFEMGFSAAEVAVLSELAAAAATSPTYDADWAPLLAPPPTCLVEVGPVLFAQNTVGNIDLEDWRTELGNFFVGEHGDVRSLPADLEVALAQFGYRLPTEREWEWCARGGRPGEVTFKGNLLPDARYFRRIRDEMVDSEGRDWETRHAALGNDFGLLGFGVDAEVCRDAFQAQVDAPFATTANFAERTVRGGAGATYKWQNPGEWHGLLTAYRRPLSSLTLAMGVRLVRDVG